MRMLAIAALALAATTTSTYAAIPLLNLTCGDGIEVHADAGGPVFIDGKESTLKTFNENYYEATHDGTTVSIAINPDGSPNASYTGRHGVNGVCVAATEGSTPVARIPLLNAECPAGISLHADEGGPVYINGKEAEFKFFSDTYFEASDGSTTVSVTVSPDGSSQVSYTGQGGANGVCEVK